jgi:hypothetical protein
MRVREARFELEPSELKDTAGTSECGGELRVDDWGGDALAYAWRLV